MILTSTYTSSQSSRHHSGQWVSLILVRVLVLVLGLVVAYYDSYI